MIYGYAGKTSLWPGERLQLHVSCGAGRFRIVLYRWTGRLTHMLSTPWRVGVRAGVRGADEDWEWPSYGVDVPEGWPSGVYIAHLEERGAPPLEVAMRDAAVLFVLRGDGRASGGLLYKLPLASYNAYNHAGGGCYHDRPRRSIDPPGARLSFLRPGVGIGGPTFGAVGHDDRAAPRQSFAHCDARLIGWLLQNGYAPDFCTDLDIHADSGMIGCYRLMLSAGHDEYWSAAMCDGVEAFVAQGGNVAFFSAKLCRWRIHLVDGASAMVYHQGGPRGALDHWWPPSGAGRPEDSMSGASDRHGGGWWEGPRETMGYAVQDPDHWIFAGTGLARGERFGAASTPPLVDDQCDGAPLAAFDCESGRAVLSPGASDCGTPACYRLLAACPLDERWQERPGREAHAGGMHAAAMGIFTRHGSVFSAGNSDWAQVLASGQDPHVDTITRNVVDGLLNGPPGRGSMQKPVP